MWLKTLKFSGQRILFNPWEGCQKVSPGCANCYAEARAVRFGTVEWGPQGTRRIASEAYWRQPLKWEREAREGGQRRRVFCASLADVFEMNEQVVDARCRLWNLIGRTPNLDWLLLTKRPENVRPLLSRITDTVEGRPTDAWKELPHYRNVWIGTSVEDQVRADERVPELLKVPAAVRFLSCEPLLGPVQLDVLNTGQAESTNGLTGERSRAGFGGHPGTRWQQYQRGVDWVIVGGESGRGARPFEPAWARSLRDKCRAAGVAFFMKQMGSRPVLFADPLPAPQGVESLMAHGEYDPDPLPLGLRDKKGGDPAEWDEDLRVREFPRGGER